MVIVVMVVITIETKKFGIVLSDSNVCFYLNFIANSTLLIINDVSISFNREERGLEK